MNTTQSSRHQYNKLLTSALFNREFIARLSIILDNDPYFMPGYLEHIWYAEADNDLRTRYAILVQAEKYINELFFNSTKRAQILQNWSDIEKEALYELIRLRRMSTGSYLKKLKLFAQAALVDSYFPLQTKLAERTGTFLRCTETLPENKLADVQAEIAGLAPYWWGIDRARSHIVHHQHTRAIALRFLPKHSIQYSAVDGVHESVPSVFVKRFPVLHGLILKFAEEHKLALGRVAIVAMQPYRQSYRHYDSEEYLKGRNRYHLVVQAGDKNLLSSGTDECYAKEGEVWFFDNHVMHRAHNKSPKERIHVIFDGHPIA